MDRALAVAAVVATIAAGTVLYRRWQAGLQRPPSLPAAVPAELLSGDRTWVLFTTPYCARCGPVEDRLRRSDPAAPVVRVDATERPDLARALQVRSAPTVLLADGAGAVVARLVGADAVDAFLARA